ncbi:uncharacterized protein LOC62_06G008042 [Vanrija pseudolonga]|uniref:Uncharacterized protein n=1 Tax=Vanrija pseudolonga TaxID=143232 RepID=A0AAF1BNM2_9TREE|nr:hypothetical protein LOC62_06G008042 [Vanrija pseudolonga]
MSIPYPNFTITILPRPNGPPHIVGVLDALTRPTLDTQYKNPATYPVELARTRATLDRDMGVIDNEIVAYEKWRTELDDEVRQLARRDMHLIGWRRQLGAHIDILVNKLGYTTGTRHAPVPTTPHVASSAYPDQESRLADEGALAEYLDELNAAADESEVICRRMEVVGGETEGLRGQIGALLLKSHNLEAAKEKYESEYTRFHAVRDEHRCKAWTAIRELCRSGVRTTTDPATMLRTALYFDILGSRSARDALRTLLSGLEGTQVRASLGEILPDLAINDEQLRFVLSFVD